MMPDTYKYNAFISYSQNPDKEIARKIEESLEQFDIGWHRLKRQKLYIFRDMTDLSLTKNLDGKIKEGLEQSEFLIVLAQKKLSSTSLNWVNQETEYFIRLCKQRNIDPTDYIILVITDGEIAWDNILNNWNFEKTNVLPSSLQNVFISQPLYVDLRKLKSSISIKQKKRVFNEVKIVIAAKLLKKKPSEIQNLVIRMQRTVIGFILVITVILVILSIFSIISRFEAKRNEAAANKSEKAAKESEVLAKKSEKAAKESEVLAKKSEKAANDSAIVAKKQREDAIEARVEADSNKNKALRASVYAKQQEKIALKKKNEADSIAYLENIAKRQTDTLNNLLTAENLSITTFNFFSKPYENKLPETIQANTDSVLKAYQLFKNTFKEFKKEHYRKIESVYMALYGAYLANMNSKTELTTDYSKLSNSNKNEIILLNYRANVGLVVNDIFRTSFEITDHKFPIYEITPVIGTNYVLWSYENNDWDLFNVNTRTKMIIQNKKGNSMSVLTNAYYNRITNQIIISNKNKCVLYLSPVKNNEFTIDSTMNKGSNIISYLANSFGNFSLSENGELLGNFYNYPIQIKGISSFGLSENSKKIFLGYIDGTLKFYDVKSNKTQNIQKFDKRINKILWSDEFNTLIVQESANRIYLFQTFNNTFVQVFDLDFGKVINDCILDKNGFFYVLYDKKKLNWWNIDLNIMANSLTNINKEMAKK